MKIRISVLFFIFVVLKTSGVDASEKLIVKFKKQISLELKQTFRNSVDEKLLQYESSFIIDYYFPKAQGLFTVTEKLDNNNTFYVLSSPSIFSPEQGAKYLLERTLQNPAVEYAQIDLPIYPHSLSSDDPLFNELWSFHSDSEWGANVTNAWGEYGTSGQDRHGNDMVVAVIDSNFYLEHVDLWDAWFINYNEIPGNGVDDDENGYIDDYRGISGFGSSSFHGTATSSVIGATGNNGVGITGINWNIKILPISTLFSSASVIKAYNYVIAMKKLWIETNGVKGANIVATNTSLSHGDYYFCNSPNTKAWNDLFDQMGRLGILSSVSAGNGLDRDIDWHGTTFGSCHSDFVISVTNVNKDGTRQFIKTNDEDEEEYSGGGSFGNQSVDIAAPGTQILTARDINFANPTKLYKKANGTSLSSPHVAGAIAWLQGNFHGKIGGYYPALTIKDVLINSSRNNENFSRITVSGGVLDLYQAIKELEKNPQGPTKSKVLLPYDYHLSGTGRGNVPQLAGQYKFGKSVDGVYQDSGDHWENIKNATILGLFGVSSDDTNNRSRFLAAPPNATIVYEISDTQWVAFKVTSVQTGTSNDRGVFKIKMYNYNDGENIDPGLAKKDVKFGLSWDYHITEDLGATRRWFTYSRHKAELSDLAHLYDVEDDAGDYEFADSTTSFDLIPDGSNEVNWEEVTKKAWEGMKAAKSLILNRKSTDNQDLHHILFKAPHDARITYEVNAEQWVTFRIIAVAAQEDSEEKIVLTIEKESHQEGDRLTGSGRRKIRFGLDWH